MSIGQKERIPESTANTSGGSSSFMEKSTVWVWLPFTLSSDWECAGSSPAPAILWTYVITPLRHPSLWQVSFYVDLFMAFVSGFDNFFEKFFVI